MWALPSPPAAQAMEGLVMRELPRFMPKEQHEAASNPAHTGAKSVQSRKTLVCGMASPSLLGIVDTIFQPQPHGVIAANPLTCMMSSSQRPGKGPHHWRNRATGGSFDRLR